jgi:hypothetical protein
LRPPANQPIASAELAHARLLETAPDMFAQPPQLFARRWIGRQEPAAEPEGAERQARRGTGAPTLESGQLHAAAADVEHQSVAHVQAPYGSLEAIDRLAAAVDNADAHAELPLDARGKLRTVGRVAHGGGGDCGNTRHTAAGGDRLEVAQRPIARHRRLGQLARRPHRAPAERRPRSGEQTRWLDVLLEYWRRAPSSIRCR